MGRSVFPIYIYVLKRGQYRLQLWWAEEFLTNCARGVPPSFLRVFFMSKFVNSEYHLVRDVEYLHRIIPCGLYEVATKSCGRPFPANLQGKGITVPSPLSFLQTSMSWLAVIIVVRSLCTLHFSHYSALVLVISVLPHLRVCLLFLRSTFVHAFYSRE